MGGFCETTKPTPPGRLPYKDSISRVATANSNMPTTGEIYQPIRVGVAPASKQQRFFKSLDAGTLAAQDRRKARIDKASIAAAAAPPPPVHHSKSVSDLNGVAAATTPTSIPVPAQRARKATLTTWSSNQTAADPLRSRSSLQQQRSNTSNGFRGALRNIFSRTGEDLPDQVPSHGSLSRQVSPLDVGGVLNALNNAPNPSHSTSTTSTDSYSKSRTHSTSAPRFIPVRTVQDIPLGISFSDNIFTDLPTHVRVAPHHTSYGSSPTNTNLSRSGEHLNHYPSRSQASNVSGKSEKDQLPKRPSTALAPAPSKGILRPSSPQPQSWDCYTGYGYGSLPGLGSANHPLAKRPSLRRPKRDSLEMIRTRSSGGSQPATTIKLQDSQKSGIPPSPPLLDTSQYKGIGTPPRSAHGSGSQTAPRMAMEEMSFAARIAELEARMTSVEVSVTKMKPSQDVPKSRKLSLAKSNTSVESRGQPSPDDLSLPSSRFGSYPGTTWLLNESEPSSRNPSAPNTPPFDARVTASLPWLGKDEAFVVDIPPSPGDDFDYLGPNASSLRDGIDYLRHELSLIRRYNGGGSKKRSGQYYASGQTYYSKHDSIATVPMHALDEHAPYLEHLERVRRSSSSRHTPSDEILSSRGGKSPSSMPEPSAIDLAVDMDDVVDEEVGIAEPTSVPETTKPASRPMKLQLPPRPDYSFAGPGPANEWPQRLMDYTPLASSDGGGRGIESYINLSPAPELPKQPLPGHVEFLRRFNSSSTVPVGASSHQEHGLHELERYPAPTAGSSPLSAPTPPVSAYQYDYRLSQVSDASSRPSNVVGGWDVPMPRSRFSFFDDTDDEESDMDSDSDSVNSDESDEEAEEREAVEALDHERTAMMAVAPTDKDVPPISTGVSVLRVPSGETGQMETSMYNDSSSPPSPLSPAMPTGTPTQAAVTTIAAATVAAALTESRKKQQTDVEAIDFAT